MDDDALAGLMQFSKKVAKAIKSAVPCKKVGVSVIGLEVAHTHIHLVPIDAVSDMNFAFPKLVLNDSQLSKVSTQIRAAFNS
jgi:histidine triad (HIT) family protein